MTPNITAMSSASPPPIDASRQPKASHAENATSAGPSSSSVYGSGVRVPATDAGAVAASAAPQTATTVPNSQLLAAAVDTMNTSLRGLQQTNLQFSMDDESGEMVVKVMDVEKDEVIRQIPPEEVLALVAFFKEAEAKKSRGVELAAPGARGLATGSAALEGLLLHAKA